MAAARLLKQKGWQVNVSDRSTSQALVQQQKTLQSAGISVSLGANFDPNAIAAEVGVKLIVVSPGVPWDLAGLSQARARGIETIGEIELAWRYLQDHPWVGITGTNGKTTTTALIAAMFQQAGLQAPACGNIGYSACDLALSAAPIDWVIAELSSYQIESSSTIAPAIGVWTTFTADHLGRHGTIERYWEIKASLLEHSHQKVLNGDDPYLRQLALKRWPDACWTSTHGKVSLPGAQGVYVEDGWIVAQGERILPIATLRMPGEHNRQNLLMAVAVARLAGIETRAIAQAVAAFTGVPHRLEHIGTWEGVDWINDSKATNYEAAQVGLASVESPVILIAGGEAKPGDDQGWLKTIQAKTAAVILIGSAAPTFAQRLEQVHYSTYEILERMERAVPRAMELAKQYQAKVVLLSPACASFDQYQSFEQRGDHFRQCLELLFPPNK